MEPDRGGAAIPRNHENSELSLRVRYWLGESYYDKIEYGQAIDSYDRVERGFPKKEKVPTAIFKKEHVYLAITE